MSYLPFGEQIPLRSSFTGSNENPLSEGGNWGTAVGGGNQLQRTGNQVAGTISTTSQRYWTPSVFGPDCEAYITVATQPGNGDNFDIMLRTQDVTLATYSGYRCRFIKEVGVDSWVITRVDNGTLTNLVTVNTTDYTSGDKIGVRVHGSTIEMWHYTGGAWSLIVSAVDTTYKNPGHVILFLRNTVCRGDDFFAGTINVPTAIKLQPTWMLNQPQGLQRLRPPRYLEVVPDTATYDSETVYLTLTPSGVDEYTPGCFIIGDGEAQLRWNAGDQQLRWLGNDANLRWDAVMRLGTGQC